jgi:hypothetical protein
MNDYYSQFPGPSFTQARDELCKPEYSNGLKQYIEKCLKEEIDTYGGLGSYTGWMFLKPRILNKIKLREKAKKMLRKLFYTFQVYGAVLQLYKDVYYKPKGPYMKSIQPVYENIMLQ